jgi:hypothetical protein
MGSLTKDFVRVKCTKFGEIFIRICD